jgi:hypothetical protein
MGYGGIAFVIFGFMVLRLWFLHGRRIPLVFIGLLLVGRYTLPEVLGPYRFELFVCLLAIALVLIDRFKSVRWHQM